MGEMGENQYLLSYALRCLMPCNTKQSRYLYSQILMPPIISDLTVLNSACVEGILLEMDLGMCELNFFNM